ncbi:MAG: 1,4-dihydroxy-2-naphthoate polyprenyltransferase [Bacteroidetes bacterium]|nr:1,4-dihydroxy-2-naphthoate polyprenyltransferase [Bacteroidota bacterium]
MTTSTMQISRVQAWILATRPKTLSAAIVPVMVGSAVAADHGVFSPLPAAVALLCALLIQIATNLANDYFDFLKGADSEHRIGPLRVTQSGLIPPTTVRNVMIAILALTFLLGMYLVAIGGWPILLIGVISIICAVLYTAGPFPLAYVGLGDVFVFLFFGIVAVTGTYYVQALAWSTDALIASLPVGAISTGILVVNNYRDIDSDRRTNKNTIAVRIGRGATRLEFQLLLIIAYAVPLIQMPQAAQPAWLLLPALSLPFAFRVVRILSRSTDGVVLNNALADTGRLLAIYGALYSIGYYLA